MLSHSVMSWANVIPLCKFPWAKIQSGIQVQQLFKVAERVCAEMDGDLLAEAEARLFVDESKRPVRFASCCVSCVPR
jgi:hypothetical protein